LIVAAVAASLLVLEVSAVAVLSLVVAAWTVIVELGETAQVVGECEPVSVTAG